MLLDTVYRRPHYNTTSLALTILMTYRGISLEVIDLISLIANFIIKQQRKFVGAEWHQSN